MRTLILLAACIVTAPAHSLSSQQAAKQRYSTIAEALASGSTLAGRPGPRGVVWID